MKVIAEVFRSSRKEGMYLYVQKGCDLESLPEALMRQFGRAEPAMVLLITPEKKLANADATKVIESIEQQGFYLQMPPTPEQLMQRIRNDKLTHTPI